MFKLTTIDIRELRLVNFAGSMMHFNDLWCLVINFN